jgi:prepilin-type N-terminal cleavage/methylation domain-containing protein
MTLRIFTSSRQSTQPPNRRRSRKQADATPAGGQAKSAQDGYTLIETIVAMALFLSVLIPLIGIMGHMMFETKSQQLNKAFSIAVSEMNRVADSKEFVDQKSINEGFIVQRAVQKSSPLIEVKITVQIQSEQPKDILVLTRVFLNYP